MTSIWTTETLSKDVREELKDEITGKTVIITGVTIGELGGEVAYDIAKYAKLLIMVGPNLDRLTKSEERILADHKDGAQIRKVVADLTSWNSVRKAADEILGFEEPIHVIILNAFIPPKPYSVTEDGYEKQFSGDHLAHSIFTKRLFPSLASSGEFQPRVVVISSDMHEFGTIDWGDLTFDGGKDYTVVAGYGRGKVANVLFAKELAKRAAKKGVIVFAVHPGAIWTNGWDYIPKEEMLKFGILKPDGSINDEFPRKQLNQGATSYLVAAFDPRIKDQSGSYVIEDGQIHNEKISEFGNSLENAVLLWDLSEKLTGEKFEI